MENTVFTPSREKVFVVDLEGGLSVRKSGLVEVDDNMHMWGIKDRWAKVWKVGRDVVDLKPGDWILMKQGRWSNRIKFKEMGEDISTWFVEYPESVLLVSDTDPRLRQTIAIPELTGYARGD
jgi:hypothetical protein